ncbi:MAG: cytochrome c1 [Salinisphaeraceae bacterium]|nr:cytochrome c1 [Salinisphaeraceae bacterium]
MKRLLTALLLSLPGTALAAGGGATAYKFDPDLGNEASLQRGAAAFINYCSGCHSMQYLRYNRIAEDLNIPEDIVRENLMFGTDKFGFPIEANMPHMSEVWFGKVPPDLTLTARAKGDDWVYSFLKTFYVEEGRPNGVNNLTLAGASMPHVLGPLQGWNKLVEKEEGAEEADDHGASHEPEFEMIAEGSLTPKEYDRLVADITNFMVYAAEPVKLVRYKIGAWALFLLAIFTTLAYLLKREYWKDVH